VQTLDSIFLIGYLVHQEKQPVTLHLCVTINRRSLVMTLWVQIDEQKGVSYWDNGVDYESLINDVRWEKISDKTIPSIRFITI
jgi:hypothetical protein